jgi:hypothetical protein
MLMHSLYSARYIKEWFMFKYLFVLWAVVLAGCSTLNDRDYTPYKSREKKAYARADRAISIPDVQSNLFELATTEVAWAGIIDEIQFKELERTIQVAFSVDQHDFDWKNYRKGKPYHLSADSQGQFTVGWTVDKPARISHLKTLAKPGYMIIAYGTPFRVDEDGVVQLSATAIRPIKMKKFLIENPIAGHDAEGGD